MPPRTCIQVAHLQHLSVCAEPDLEVIPGHQWLWIPRAADGAGEHLARLLCPDAALVEEPEPGWLRIPHDGTVDTRLVQLVDLCAALRYAAPQLMQLSFLAPAFGGIEADARVEADKTR